MLASAMTMVAVSAWLVFWDGGESIASFERNAPLMDQVMPEWAGLDAQGMPFRREHGFAEWNRMWAAAKKHEVQVFGMVSNYADTGFDAKRAQKMLHDPAHRAAHIERLVAMAVEDGLDGIDIDIESLEAGDRDVFSAYMEELRVASSAEGLLLSIAVHAKSEEPGSWGGVIAQDWKRLGAAVDVFRIMGYDLHWATSEAGPIGPTEWATSVAAFAGTLMPAAKVELGIPGYGYTWKGNQGRTILWDEWTDLVSRYGPARQDPGGEMVLTYPGYTAYMATGSGQAAKVAWLQQNGFRGVALWRLGGEDPSLWDLFR